MRGYGEGQHYEGNQRHREGQRLGDRMRDLIDVLSGVATLFLSPREFKRHYGRGVSAGHRFDKVRSGCAACVLAAVGSRTEVLVALRANIKAREKCREPRLLALVEAWMKLLGGRRRGR